MENPLVAHRGTVGFRQEGAAPSLAELKGQRFILREPGSGTRMAVDQHFRKHRFHPDVRLELGSNEAVKEAVAGGLGLGVVSLHALQGTGGLRDISVARDRGLPRSPSRWHVVHPKAKQLSPIAAAFRAAPAEAGAGMSSAPPMRPPHSTCAADRVGERHERHPRRPYARQPLCLVPAVDLAGARRGGRHRAVARRRRAAHDPGGIRRGPRRRLAALYRDLHRLRLRRLRHGPGGRPVRHHGAGVDRGRVARAGLLPRRPVAELLAVRGGAGGVHRLPRLRRHLRAAGGRYLAMVPQAARHRRSPSWPAATTSPAPSGRPSCRRRSRTMAGAPPTWRSASSASW